MYVASCEAEISVKVKLAVIESDDQSQNYLDNSEIPRSLSQIPLVCTG